jgi:hypothetical protein
VCQQEMDCYPSCQLALTVLYLSANRYKTVTLAASLVRGLLLPLSVSRKRTLTLPVNWQQGGILPYLCLVKTVALPVSQICDPLHQSAGKGLVTPTVSQRQEYCCQHSQLAGSTVLPLVVSNRKRTVILAVSQRQEYYCQHSQLAGRKQSIAPCCVSNRKRTVILMLSASVKSIIANTVS